MEFDLTTLIITIIVTFLGGLIQGTVAFGLGIFIVICLAWVFPSKSLIPFVTLVAALNLLDMSRRRGVSLQSILSPVLIIPSLLGVILGTYLLLRLPDWGVKLSLGLAVFLAGIVFVFRHPGPRGLPKETDDSKNEPWGSLKAAIVFLGSIFGGWISMGGPPLIFYAYVVMPLERAQRFLIRAFLVSVGIRLFTYGYSGLWSMEILLWTLICLVFVLAGTALGHNLAERLPTERLSRLAWIIFTVMGFLLSIKNLFQSPIV